MTKEEVIKQAYGIHWDAVKDYVDADGWCVSIRYSVWRHFRRRPDVDFLPDMFRPKSLQGIENNNGWIKIESAKDWPSDYSIEYKGVSPNGEIFTFNLTAGLVKTKYYNRTLTHYKPIAKDNPPLY